MSQLSCNLAARATCWAVQAIVITHHLTSDTMLQPVSTASASWARTLYVI